jgi:hypothetical protein
MPQANLVRNWIFHFRKTQRLTKENRQKQHPADAAEQDRTRGAQKAESLRLNDYGFLTSVAV